MVHLDLMLLVVLLWFNSGVIVCLRFCCIVYCLFGLVTLYVRVICCLLFVAGFERVC